MKSVSFVQKQLLRAAAHFCLCMPLAYVRVCEAHAATQKTPCPVRTSSLLAASYKSQKTWLDTRDVVPPELEPCLKTWRSADWQGALYMWNESKRGEEPYSFVLSPSVSAALLHKRKETVNSHQTDRPPSSADEVEAWQSLMLRNSSGHELRHFQDVYVMCVHFPDQQGALGATATSVPGPNCSWIVVSPSDDCQTWDLEMDNPTDARMTEMSNLTIDAIEVDTAITIAHRRGGAVYHAPIDIISSLVHVNRSLLWNDSVYLHVHTETAYVKEWLSVVGISPDRLISGDLRSKRLYVPELHTEQPSRAQLHWLQHRVWNGIGFPDLFKRNLLIVSKRKVRGISHHDEVVQLAKEYAAAHGLEVFIHDDEHLRTVKEQLESFSRAVMLLAPHGAGESFIIATLPGACVVEIFPAFYHDPSLARLFTLLGHHYTGIDLRDEGNGYGMFGEISPWSGNSPNTAANATELRVAMERCGHRAGVL
eukprot:TRINITY_DN545_c0_g1_i2.p1 TRINITY_DN545_c0_g1~~TRINITY_DN545_c0_g1_i2.p1  ORF type:complete len:480 (-),score=55.31 TRINITY_DN545_c0_g1_i2:275-1714(-)